MRSTPSRRRVDGHGNARDGRCGRDESHTRARHPQVKVLALSSYQDADLVRNVLQAGARSAT